MARQTLYSTEISNNKRTVSGTLTVFADDVSLYCDTSGGAVNINLLQIPAGNWNTEYILYVKDASGLAATNNITIIAPIGFLINGAQTFVININSASVEVTISTDTDYLVNSGGSSTPALTQVVIARTAFVSKNGSDSTGLIERLDKPFLTIAAARAAMVTAISTYYVNVTPGLQTSVPTASDRLLIKVFTGLYAERVVLLNFLDFDLSDSVITGSAFRAIVDNSVDCDSIVYGSAKINSQVLIGGASTLFRLSATSISSGSVAAIRVTAGVSIINVPTIQNSSGDASTSVLLANSGGKMIINNARVVNTQTDLCSQANGGGIVIINNCTLLTGGVQSVDGTIYVYGACQSNVAVKSTAIQKISTILIDPNVQ